MDGFASRPAAGRSPRLNPLLPLYLATATMLAAAAPALATWTPDGVPVAIAANDQRAPVLVPDGAGGTIIVWWDERDSNLYISAQRLDGDGNPLWGADGIVVAVVEWVTVDPQAIADGLGGAYVIWSDSRAGHPDDHLYAQRIGANGAALWPAAGIEVCPGGDRQHYPAAVTDYRPQVGLNTPGVIVVWEDTRIPATFNVYTQHLDMNGVRLWGDAGLGLSNSGGLEYPVVTTDGTASPFFSAGAIVAWQTSAGDIRANWVNANGVVQWGANGLAVSTASGIQDEPSIATVGPRRVVVAWEDSRSAVTGLDVYAQKVDNGVVSWAADGVPVCNLAGDQYRAQTAPAAGGAFVAWQDGRDPDDHDIYGQRLDSNGAPLWTPNGVAVCSAQGPQVAPEIEGDGEGGAFVVWMDTRGGARGDDTDLYAQRMTDGGAAQWQPDGVVVSGAGGDQKSPEILLNGSFLNVAWEDTRNGANGDDVYAGRLTGAGTVAVAAAAPATELRMTLLSANPQSGLVRFGVELPAATHVAAEVVDATGRRVRELGGSVLPAGGHVLSWDGRNAAGAPLPSGVYFVRMQAGVQSSTLKLVRLP